MPIMTRKSVLDHGYVHLRNIAGPTRRLDQPFDANDVDPANAARFSFDGADQDRKEEEDLKLARYLYKNRHTTPFEMVVIWLEMKMPIFVARQFVRHRTVSINEVSARYTKLEPDFYIPELKNIGVKSKSNKQGRVLGANEVGEQFQKILRRCCAVGYSTYTKSIDHGIPNEVARMVLPLNIYTKWLWKQDLHNMLHFLRLRMHEHAQFEARMYANAIHDLLCQVMPHTMNMFDELEKENE